MTTRTDIAFDIRRSPRISIVPNTSDEIIMQDYVDTTRVFEDSFEAMSQEHMINASGKEDLGGGVLVAITAEEQDTKLEFQPTLIAAETGTVTTGSGPAVSGEQTFIDSAATFITNGVARGSMVINFTDNSIADVVEVISETVLTTKALVNGIGNEYDSSDVYQIFNVRQVTTSGGNLVAVDTLDDPTTAISPTAFTQVIQSTSSSATIQESEDIQFASFEGGVALDVDNNTGNAVSGTDFPTGTGRQPSDNISDAHTIISDLGLIRFFVIGDLLVDDIGDAHPHIFVGQSTVRSLITLDTVANLVSAEFENATIQGVLDGETSIRDCVILNLTMFDGNIKDSIIGATITLGGGLDASIIQCAGSDPVDVPTVNMGGSGQSLLVQDYNGDLTIENMTGAADTVDVTMSAGELILDSTCTNGTITVSGIAKLTDNSGAGCTVINELLNQTTIADSVWNALTATYTLVGSFGQFIKTRLLTVTKFFGMQR